MNWLCFNEVWSKQYDVREEIHDAQYTTQYIWYYFFGNKETMHNPFSLLQTTKYNTVKYNKIQCKTTQCNVIEYIHR